LTTVELIAAIAEIDPADAPALLAAIAALLAKPHSNGASDDELVDVSEAARITGLSESALYHGKFPFTVRLGRRRMFSRAGIQRYIAKNAGK
jgi:predicted DNA-binding transcriptional regulator AlpA